MLVISALPVILSPPEKKILPSLITVRASQIITWKISLFPAGNGFWYSVRAHSSALGVADDLV
jgi:hypothetical protein